MMRKIAIIMIVTLFLAAACSDNEPASQIETSKPVQMDKQNVAQGDTQGDVLVKDQGVDFNSLEVTPSGDPKCFLSPCDCNCYVIPNVPQNKRSPLCADSCADTQGIKGCRFTNFQCATIK
ncbi:MAG TPA: hypothetical protein VJI75_04060 [Candidatus Nanoarchaeia archaeon]|nr:hypothetical protein [Candidatus Nanoarchaeia archaeon]